jgi:hypothetical protein
MQIKQPVMTTLCQQGFLISEFACLPQAGNCDFGFGWICFVEVELFSLNLMPEITIKQFIGYAD